MFAAMIALSLMLAALIGYAAARKLSHRPEVVAEYARVGVPEERLDLLAFLLLAGAAGLVAGLAWAPIGIVAAAGLVVYFLAAIAAHVRAREALNRIVPAVVLTLFAAAVLVLRMLAA